MILYEETLFQDSSSGVSIADLFKNRNIQLGIKVDKGAVPLEGGRDDEVKIQGLDGLAERCQKYYARGARFAKWCTMVDMPIVLDLRMFPFPACLHRD